MEKGGFTGPGLVPVRYSAQDHSGYGGEQLTRISKGVATYFGKPYRTDDGDGAVEVFETPAAAPPQNGIPAA